MPKSRWLWPAGMLVAVWRAWLRGRVEVQSITLDSPQQRAAFDVEAFGSIGQPFLRLGKDGSIIHLKP